jgi:hypothetical protein
LREQASRFEALVGLTLTGWRGVEMALYGGEDRGDAVFLDPRAPFQQLRLLRMELAGERTALVDTYQDDDGWGLWLTEREPRWDGYYGIYREGRPALPTGPIRSVAVWLYDGLLAEVRLRIGEQELLLVAGETSENWDGGFDLHWLDESVLVFTDTAAADWLPWKPARPSVLADAWWRLGDRVLQHWSERMLEGADVADLQRRLMEFGFDAGQVDGVFGPITARAVTDFQQAVGLRPDGICGPETVRAFERLERSTRRRRRH